MKTEHATRHVWDDLPKEAVKADLHRRLVTGERLMLAQVFLDEGCMVPQHRHENEQVSWILEGRLRFWLGEDEAEVVDLAAGEVLHVPSWLPHRAEALEQCFALDVFCPPRQDWLDGTDSYLREPS